ncbi:membrane protein DedA, SNARE-associated domain [Kaistella treverensis]|uniref:Membrane protein DedA, SNARE-associated domain n=1 Tax=Kaistella treverensis TaxID=631455 RepID=A0A1I3MBJ6_9FLAO|nr:hypothetical protein [Kaistella treverensis]SFI94105.1 membrane protein DedA, SNARE-associated domain [Kaistella treverensis]
MWWQYILVFLGALLFDIVPFPFPPAFTVMVFLQILYDLDVWTVIFVGVAGSVLGRYILLLYAPLISNRFLKAAKNEDIQFLGEKMNENKWVGQLFVLAYSLLPLPTTPLFLGAGISKIKPIYIIPAFLIGKFTSDSVALHLGNYASENWRLVIDSTFSWESFASLFLSLTLLFFLLFIDWRTLIQKKKFLLNFKIWK